MKNSVLLLVSLACCLPSASAQSRVLVIESQSSNGGHTMDNQWAALASAAGFITTPGTQADLASNAFHATTDILIISSGVIGLPPAAQASVAAFVAAGGRLYLQAEYQTTFTTNVLFATLVAQSGGSFTWTSTVSGGLEPVAVSGALTQPLATSPLDYFWYGATGTGVGVSEVLHASTGQPVGWVVAGNGGRIVCMTDQDCVRSATIEDLAVMENILRYLDVGGGLGSSYCGPAVVNSSGNSAQIVALGSTAVAQNNVTLSARSLPTNSFGFFLTSRTAGFAQNPGGSQGNLCLGGAIGRYVGPGQIQNSGAQGEFSLALDLTQTPTPIGFVSVAVGETWNYQGWFRDAVGGVATSNFTDGTAIAYQ